MHGFCLSEDGVVCGAKMDLLHILIGRRLANQEGETRKLTALGGVPAMGLGSSAYGPEAALTILMPIGAAGLHLITPIMTAILVLLALLFISYWQTIEAYPGNGGSYTVAEENLAANAGLLASALMIDYVLNVAVGISAGIGALTSAVPPLHPYTLPLCLAVLAAITLVNLRGTLEAGLVFSVPTYRLMLSAAAEVIADLSPLELGRPSHAPDECARSRMVQGFRTAGRIEGLSDPMHIGWPKPLALLLNVPSGSNRPPLAVGVMSKMMLSGCCASFPGTG
jgi:hypothetical protein